MRILFVTPRYPSPPVKGDQLRAYHQIRVLSRDHQVTLLSHDRPLRSANAEHDVSRFCEKVIPAKVRSVERVFQIFAALLSGSPLQVGYYRSSVLRRIIAREMSSGAYDLVVVQLIRMASYFNLHRRIPCVIDLVDSLGKSTEERAKFASSPMKWIWRMEAERCANYERQVLGWFDSAFTVSESDKSYIDGGQGTEKLKVVPNGVDLEHFRPHSGERDPATLLFFGNMGFFPNVDAAVRLVKEILPKLRKERPETRLILLGASPHARVLALKSEAEGVEVTGYVPDLRPYLQRATLAIFPIELGSGQQNKVLEAMASGLPVVTTPFVLNGVRAQRGIHLKVGQSSEEIAAIAQGLLRDPVQRASLALTARKFVEANYSWEANVSQILAAVDVNQL